MHYLITWDESDGNDCTVYDTIIEAPSEDAALDKLSKAVEADLTGEFEADGSEFGYFFGCDDDCAEECDGHGGISLRVVEAFKSADEARKNLAQYHTRYEV